MTILRNTRRITELTVQRKLFHTPLQMYCGVINKDKQLLRKEEFGDNTIKRGPSDGKWFRNVKNIKSHQNIPDNGLPNVYNMIENHSIQKKAMKRDIANKKRYSDAKKNMSYQRIPSKDLANVYDMIPHNHVIAPNKVLSNELKANRNQIIYHRVFNVPDVNRQKSFFRPAMRVKWFAKRKDEKGGTVIQTGGQFDKPSSADEDGFLHKHDKERWRELKSKLGKQHEPDAMKKT